MLKKKKLSDFTKLNLPQENKGVSVHALEEQRYQHYSQHYIAA